MASMATSMARPYATIRDVAWWAQFWHRGCGAAVYPVRWPTGAPSQWYPRAYTGRRIDGYGHHMCHFPVYKTDYFISTVGMRVHPGCLEKGPFWQFWPGHEGKIRHFWPKMTENGRKSGILAKTLEKGPKRRLLALHRVLAQTMDGTKMDSICILARLPSYIFKRISSLPKRPKIPIKMVKMTLKMAEKWPILG